MKTLFKSQDIKGLNAFEATSEIQKKGKTIEISDTEIMTEKI